MLPAGFQTALCSGIEVDIQQQDRETTYSKYFLLVKIRNTIANLTPSTIYLEGFDHTTKPPQFQPLDKNRVTISISLQEEEDVAEANTNLTNILVNDPSHLLLYTDGSQTRTGSNGTGLIAIHAEHPHSETLWNLGKHVEVYDTELFGLLQATTHAREWIEANPGTNTIWIFVDNQAAIRRCTKPHPTPGQHLSLQIINNLQTILNTRPNTKVNIQCITPGEITYRMSYWMYSQGV